MDVLWLSISRCSNYHHHTKITDYLHNWPLPLRNIDYLGSVSVATKADGTLANRQEFDPWGRVRSGNVGETTLNYTGQRRDAPAPLFYNARYYDRYYSYE